MEGPCVNNKQSLYMPKAKTKNAYWGASVLKNSFHFRNLVGLDINQNTFNLMLAGDLLVNYYNVPTMSAIDAYVLDLKIDYGKPNSGKFVVSAYEVWDYGDYIYWSDGVTDYFLDSLSVDSQTCTIGGVDGKDVAAQYNSNPATGGNTISCQPAFVW